MKVSSAKCEEEVDEEVNVDVEDIGI